MGTGKTFLESLIDPMKKKKKKKDEPAPPPAPPPPPTENPWKGKAGSYLERKEEKKKRLDEVFE